MRGKIIGAALAAILTLTACSLPFVPGGSTDQASGDSTAELAQEILAEEPLVAKAEDDGRTHIGILMYRDHGASQETVDGFTEEMRALLGSGKVDFEIMNADGDAGKCAEIATGFANSGYKLIFACGTEAVQNAGAAVKDVPIIGGCVTDYLLSETVSSLEAPGSNITGVSSLGPIDEQVELVMRITPWPAAIGIVSSGTEVGSRFQESVAGQCLDEKQVEWYAYHASTEDGLRKAMEMAAEECSCIYLPTDSFVAAHMDIVRDVVIKTGVMTVTGDYQMCSQGGLCCCSIDYYEHGRKAANMAYAVLEKGEEISRMAIQEENEWQEYYNPVIAQKLDWYNYGNMIPLSVNEEDYAEEDAAGLENSEENSAEENGAEEDSAEEDIAR